MSYPNPQMTGSPGPPGGPFRPYAALLDEFNVDGTRFALEMIVTFERILDRCPNKCIRLAQVEAELEEGQVAWLRAIGADLPLVLATYARNIVLQNGWLVRTETQYQVPPVGAAATLAPNYAPQRRPPSAYPVSDFDPDVRNRLFAAAPRPNGPSPSGSPGPLNGRGGPGARGQWQNTGLAKVDGNLVSDAEMLDELRMMLSFATADGAEVHVARLGTLTSARFREGLRARRVKLKTFLHMNKRGPVDMSEIADLEQDRSSHPPVDPQMNEAMCAKIRAIIHESGGRLLLSHLGNQIPDDVREFLRKHHQSMKIFLDMNPKYFIIEGDISAAAVSLMEQG